MTKWVHHPSARFFAAARARSRFTLALLSLAGLLSFAPLAHAHPELERGKRLASELDFEQAVSAFDSAVASGTLTRKELIELLVERALLLYGLKRSAALESDFTWLSALAPDHKLDLRAPPELIAIWTSLRDQGHGPLRLELATQMIDAAPEVILEARAELAGTVPKGTRTRIALRRKGKVWRSQVGGEIRDRGMPGDSMELYAEALGLGGMVVARLHSPSAPLLLTLRPHEAGALALDLPPADNVEPRNEGGSWGKRHRGWLIGGAVVLVAAAATLTTLYLLRDKGEDRSDQTVVKPMLRF
jgi:hypothetical protein